MTKQDLEEFLNSIHHRLAEKLLARLDGVKVITKEGEVEEVDVSAADLNVIRQFLKDNNVTGIATNDNPLGRLAKKLPTSFGDDHSVAH